MKVLHHDVGALVGDPGVDDVDDVGVADLVHRLRFEEETPRQVFARCEVGSQELDGDHAPGERVLGAKHLAHTTSAEVLDEAILPSHEVAGWKLSKR